jgi:hypothetical protein
MLNVISNFWYALLALFILTLILHFFLVYPDNLSKKKWKSIDYLWITLTAIGLIGATSNAKAVLSKNILAITKNRISFQYNYIHSFLPTEGSNAICRDFVRTEFSPSNFDSIVTDYNNTCDWSKKVFQLINLIDTTNFQLIDTTKIPHLQTKDNNWFKNVIVDNIREYNKLITQNLESQIQVDESEQTEFVFYTPLLLILGLAIRITKVTGELLHEK